MSETQYILTLTPAQAKTVNKAVELLMRLKINQPEEIPRAVMDSMYERIGCDEFCKRRDQANNFLKLAFLMMFTSWDEVKKDPEWYRLYNVYQVIRYAIHNVENPDGVGVDAREPMAFTDEPLPMIEVRRAK